MSLTAHEPGSPDEPRVRDAVFGALFGILLVYLGTLVSSRIVRWPLIALGVLFIGVMSAFVLVVAGQRLAVSTRPLVQKVRGHVRNDPVLGTLVRDVKARAWIASVPRATGPVELMISGDAEPDPRLLARAREVVATFDELERRVADYLTEEADQESSADADMSDEIRALRLLRVRFESPDRTNHLSLDLEGRDEAYFWYCEDVDGELRGLDYDT